jgi:hypothetical protein
MVFRIPLSILCVFITFFSYSQNLSYVYFSVTADTVMTVEEDYLTSDLDTTSIILSILKKENTSPSTIKIVCWREKVPDLIWRNDEYQLNADSSNKYGIVERSECLDRDSVSSAHIKFENYHIKRTGKWRKVCSKGCGFSAEFRFTGDVTFSFDSSIIFHQQCMTINFLDGVQHKTDVIPDKELLYDAVNVRIFRSFSGKYFIALEYYTPVHTTANPYGRKLDSCLVVH